MLFDTDVLIWFLRGNAKAARAIDAADRRSISIVTYMELLQGARDKRETHHIRSFLNDFGFTTVPLSGNTGHRASIYIEEYALASAIGVADALIAATAVEANEVLLTGNARHYKPIQDLQMTRFRPS